MRRVVAAASLYVALVFAAGFVLGTLRVLVMAPALGEVLSVMAEIPVMLALSWLAARRVVARLDIPARVGPRLAMGVLAFLLLMLAELALGLGGFGQSVADYVAALARPAGLLGLAGQAVFGLMPLLLLAGRRRG